MSSFDVRVFAIRRRPGRAAFEVRWQVAGRQRSRSFMTRGLADSFRAELVRAARQGAGFDPATGEPAAWAVPKPVTVTWYQVDRIRPELAASYIRAGCGVVVSISDSANPVSIASFPPVVTSSLPSWTELRIAVYRHPPRWGGLHHRRRADHRVCPVGFGFVEFATPSSPVKLVLYGRRALAKDAGVSPDGTGSHRLMIGSDAGYFTDRTGSRGRPHRSEPGGTARLHHSHHRGSPQSTTVPNHAGHDSPGFGAVTQGRGRSPRARLRHGARHRLRRDVRSCV